MGVSIVELPNEILSQIFSHFAGDKGLLTLLAPLCHLFSQQVRPVLLRSITLFITPKGVAELDRLNQLVRTLRADPLLASLVQVLDVQWQSGNWTIYKSMNSLLEQTKELRSLALFEKDHVDEPPFPQLSDLESNPLPKLTDLVINQKRTTIDHISNYMFHGQLESLTVLSLAYNTEMPTIPKGCKLGASPISSLNLGSTSRIPLLVLQELLRWPRALMKLRSTLPGDVQRLPFWRDETTIMDHPLSPANVMESLAPVKGSLMELELIDSRCKWPSHDLSQLDLSDFASLVKLSIPSTCFFALKTPGKKRNGLYKLLPHSLVELTIIYDFNDAICPPQEDADGKSIEAPLTRTDCYWIEEFAIYKTTHFPNLERVAILERIGKLSSRIYPENWTIPIAVEGALKEAGIAFRGLVRASTRF